MIFFFHLYILHYKCLEPVQYMYILFYTLLSIIQLLPISILMICKKSLYYEINYHQSCVYLMLINLKEINHDIFPFCTLNITFECIISLKFQFVKF